MPGETEKVDRRVVRTKRAIRNAFAALLSVKDVDDITVRELADAADISRKTFYNYYNGIYQVLDEIENEVISDMEEALTNADYSRDMRDPSRVLLHLTQLFRSDPDFYGHLMRMNRNSSFIVKLDAALKNAFKASLLEKTTLTPQQADIVLNYTISGLFSVYQSWFLNPQNISLEELSQTVGYLTIDGVTGYADHVGALKR